MSLATHETSTQRLADRLGISKSTLFAARDGGMNWPDKTEQGYCVSEFKAAYREYKATTGRTMPTDLRDRKTWLECERLGKAIAIDDIRLSSEELKLAEQRKELMPVAEHKQKMVAAAQLYVTSIEQGIENASTQMRSAEMRAVLEKVFNAVRKRVARSIEG